jgi:UDP-3-O-[3-hydroxymyristoyl] N-acetylglucosamine deacetylase
MAAPTRRATTKHVVQLPPAPGALSRRAVTVSLEPIAIGSGLRLQRSDLGREWPIDLEHVVELPNCTAIGDGRDFVAFVEHLMAALRASFISDVLVITDGPEIPLYDGSALAFCEALKRAGRAESAEPWEHFVIRDPVEVGSGEAVIRGVPAPSLSMTYELSHPHARIGEQTARFGGRDVFARDLAPARTFATADEIRALYQMDPTREMEQLCVIVYADHISAASALEAPFARHKLLDLMGDLYLCGRVLVGEITAQRSGHALNRAFLRGLLAREQPPQA